MDLMDLKDLMDLTLLEVFRRGTSFSALIFASISFQTSALFWNKTLRGKMVGSVKPQEVLKPPETLNLNPHGSQD